jgi:glycosyltransferase involved in cell wall biosynthesis
MRVLLITFGRNRFTYPVSKIAGGIEMVELNQIEALQSLGIDFTLGITSDAGVTGCKYEMLPIESFESCGQYKLTKLLDFINESKLYDQYDVILTNRAWSIDTSHKRMAKVEKWAHKVRLINHEPPVYLNGFHFPNLLATHKWLVGHGAKVSTVMDGGKEFYAGLEESLRTGKKFTQLVDKHTKLLDSVPWDPFNGFYEVNVVPYDAVPLEKIDLTSGICFVGRPSPHKGLQHAVKGTVAAGLIKDFIGHTVSPNSESEKSLWKRIQNFQSHFTVGANHGEIMKDISKSRVFLQPSLSECSGGIVSFEAAVHGVPVVTATRTPRRYLEPYGLFNFIEDRDPATIAKAILEAYNYTLEVKIEKAERVRQTFSRKIYAQRLLDFLQ